MNRDRIDEAALALLHLGVHEPKPGRGARTWKSFDWDAMEGLHQKDQIANPVGKARSVFVTEAGLRRSKEASLTAERCVLSLPSQGLRRSQRRCMLAAGSTCLPFCQQNDRFVTPC